MRRRHPVSLASTGEPGPSTLTTGDVTGAGGAPIASRRRLTGSPDDANARPKRRLVKDRLDHGFRVSNVARLEDVSTRSMGGRERSPSPCRTCKASAGLPWRARISPGRPRGRPPLPGPRRPNWRAPPSLKTPLSSSDRRRVAASTRESGAVTLLTSDITGGRRGLPSSRPISTGSPTSPTPTAGDSSTKIATTAYVETAIGSLPPGVATFSRTIGTSSRCSLQT